MFNYIPSETGAKFLADQQSFVKLIMGPVGGGKSTVAVMDVLRRIVRQEPYKGERLSKVIVLRNTMQQLMSTVKPLIDAWFVTIPASPMGEWRISDKIFEMRFKLKDGSRVKADIIMMAADTPDDVRRLLSVECSFAWAEECREVDEEVFSGLQGRVNRWPSRAMGGVTYAGVIGSTNPPAQGTFWFDVITNPPAKWAVYIQPPALLDDGSLNPHAENLANLPSTYYDDLISGKTQEWINVYLKNKFGSGGAGLPIYRNSFKKSFHVAESKLLAIPGQPIIVGMDNGLQAATTCMQMDARGRVNVIGNSYVPKGETMGVESFLDRILIPDLIKNFPTVPRAQYLFVLDPACFERSQVDEKTIDMAVRARMFRSKKSPITSNDPERRISAVEGLFARAIDGKAGMLISPELTHLIAALEYGYKYKVTKNEDAQPVIDKNHWSHTAESHQYGCSHYNVGFDATLAGFKSQARTVVAKPYMYT